MPEVMPLNSVIGAEVHGIDCSRPLTDEDVAFLREAATEHAVVFLRNQHVTPQQLKDAAGRFGSFDRPPFLSDVGDGLEDVGVVDLTPRPGAWRANYWHQDGTWLATPPQYIMLMAIQIPPKGGDTLWCSLADVYEQLSAPLRRALDGLSAVHAFPDDFVFPHDNERSWEVARTLTATHPVVLTHPDSKRSGLFVNRLFTMRILEVSSLESRHLLDLIFEQVSLPEHQVRWTWRPGDIAMWDNLAALHYAALDYSERRVMHRVAILTS